MKNLFQKEVVEEILCRLNKLTPNNQKLWGKLNVDQMLAHCSVGIQIANGEIQLKSLFVIRLFGQLLKFLIIRNSPLMKNLPSYTKLKIRETAGFKKEKQNLVVLINNFYLGGTNKVIIYPHPFLGKLTPNEWGILMYKHLDHHFRQFGV